MAQPTISVLMPAYKAEATIKRAAKSVLEQDWPDLELVISSDDGEDYIGVLSKQGLTDDRIRQVMTGGVGTGDWNARNAALKAAEGELVTLIDSDDEYASGRLSALAPLALGDGQVNVTQYVEIIAVPLIDFVKGNDGLRHGVCLSKNRGNRYQRCLPLFT